MVHAEVAKICEKAFRRMQRSSAKTLEPCNQTSQVHAPRVRLCTCEVWLHGSNAFELERCIRAKLSDTSHSTPAWTTPYRDRYRCRYRCRYR